MQRTDHHIACFQLNFAPAPGGSRWAGYEAEVDQRVLARYIGVDGVFGLNGMNIVARLRAAEDVHLGYDLYQAGVAVAFLPEVTILHQYPNRLGQIICRKFWHGQGYALVFRRCPDLFRLRPLPGRLVWPWLTKYARPGFVLYSLLSQGAFLAGLGYARCAHVLHFGKLA
jgi:hypothetical protein